MASSARFALLATFALAALGAIGVRPAAAVVTPARVLDVVDVVDVGGVALASDGTGGMVYRRVVDGRPHVFVVRFDRGGWSAPMRVDGDVPFAANLPHLAAAPRGRLLVAWVQDGVTQESGVIRSRLVSATLGPKATSFTAPLIVDRDVRAGVAVDPAVAMTATGRAHVVYRVVTGESSPASYRPDDVQIEVRAAYLNGPTWSSMGVLSRNATVPQRKPTADNAPRLAESPMGGAVAAWQETDKGSGVAGVLARRLFASVPGPLLRASATTLDGTAVDTDVDAFGLGVTELGQANVAMRLLGSGSRPQRLVLNRLPVSLDKGAATFAGAAPAPEQPPAGRLGVPSVAVADGGATGDVQIAYTADGAPRMLTLLDGKAALQTLGDPIAGADGVQITLNPDGGGVVAWPTVDAAGGPAVAIRQDYPSGAFQSAVVGGEASGPVSALAAGGSGYGDALVGFAQGAPGRVQAVAAVVSAPPPAFRLLAPGGWVKPSQAVVRWEPPHATFGGLRYSLVVDGIVRGEGLTGVAARLAQPALGDGRHDVQVIATDKAGQQTATPSASVKVDGVAPTIKVRHLRGKRRVRLTVLDAGSGPVGSATRATFGDGGRAAGGRTKIAHVYRKAGTYTITAAVRDRMGHRATRRVRVRVR